LSAKWVVISRTPTYAGLERQCRTLPARSWEQGTMTTTTGKNRPGAEHKIRKSSLDKDLRKITRIEDATRAASLNIVALSGGILFLAAAGLIAASQIAGEPRGALIVVGAILAGYMAMNIGANDVANNVGLPLARARSP
jgi:hypothetical protein